MALRFYITRSRREWLPAVALLFLLQTLAPAFAGVMASPVVGYIDILCTMSGPQTVFVPLDEQQQHRSPACHECPSCILQLGFDDEAALAPSTAQARAQILQQMSVPAAHPQSESRHYSRYLSRAPPA